MDSARNTIVAGLKSQPAGYRNATDEYDQFYLIIVRTGVLHYEDDVRTAAVRAGGMVVLRTGSRFVLHTDQEGYSGIAVAVSPGSSPPYSGGASVPFPFVPHEVTTIADWLFRELSTPREDSSTLIELLARAAVLYSLRALRRDTGAEAGDPSSRHWAHRVDEAIRNAVYTDQPVAEILDRLEPSYRQLSRYLARELGTTPKSLQLQHKMAEACRLLKDTTLSVTAIALELGFSSTQHFTARFRQRFELPPAAWRRSSARVVR
jgi:AraC-like DNA-binding protein